MIRTDRRRIYGAFLHFMMKCAAHETIIQPGGYAINIAGNPKEFIMAALTPGIHIPAIAGDMSAVIARRVNHKVVCPGIGLKIEITENHRICGRLLVCRAVRPFLPPHIAFYGMVLMQG